MIGSVAEAQAQLADIEKRRKRKPGREEPVTDAHAVALGQGDSAEAGPAAKAYADLGAHDGPGQGMQPGHAEQYQRPYIEPGHGANSPQAGPLNQNPMPALPPGVPVPISLPDTPMAVRVPAHVTSAYSSGSPSDR